MQMEDRLPCGRSVGLNNVHALGVRRFGNSCRNSTSGISQVMRLTVADRPYIWQVRGWNNKRMTKDSWHIWQEGQYSGGT